MIVFDGDKSHNLDFVSFVCLFCLCGWRCLWKVVGWQCSAVYTEFIYPSRIIKMWGGVYQPTKWRDREKGRERESVCVVGKKKSLGHTKQKTPLWGGGGRKKQRMVLCAITRLIAHWINRDQLNAFWHNGDDATPQSRWTSKWIDVSCVVCVCARARGTKVVEKREDFPLWWCIYVRGDVRLCVLDRWEDGECNE